MVQALDLWLGRLIRVSARALLDLIEPQMARIERRRDLTGPGTLSALYQTYEQNKEAWESYDWSLGGEEWTDDARTLRGRDPQVWKASIVRLIEDYVPEGSDVLEIGPGAGRWTAELVQRARRVAVADIAERCLEICEERFGERVERFLVDEHPALDVPDASFDVVWSYDVFVHINPPGVDAWLTEVSRVLRPGGHAVIHHGGGGEIGLSHQKIGQTNLDARYFRHLAEKHGLEVLLQDASRPHHPGDVISVCRAPAHVAGLRPELSM